MFLYNKYLGIELGGTKHSYKSIIFGFPAVNKENKEISIIDRNSDEGRDHGPNN